MCCHYDTGDFLPNYAVDPLLRNDQSLIFFANVDMQGVRELWLVPVRLEYAALNRASGADLEGICSWMRGRSAELGTTVERMDSVLHVAVRSVEGAWREVGRS